MRRSGPWAYRPESNWESSLKLLRGALIAIDLLLGGVDARFEVLSATVDLDLGFEIP